ncbi:hypothetical protein CAAN1_22S00122 [[Candida] anglica]|uniref:Uncharacterized protein n=1 Tax=[Candida] anglica TaxID=148631 RepID=A0ABP0EL98_9ASCO
MSVIQKKLEILSWALHTADNGCNCRITGTLLLVTIHLNKSGTSNFGTINDVMNLGPKDQINLQSFTKNMVSNLAKF